jgi:hypothetical protein
MTTSIVQRRWIGFAFAAITWAFGSVAGCSGDDNGVNNNQFVRDSGVDATAMGDSPSAADGPAILLICQTYGGYGNVSQYAAHILTSVTADCRIGPYFTALDSMSSAHLSECFQKQLGVYFGCPGVAYDKDSAGQQCRSMSDAHNNLNLRKADFDAFIEDMVASLLADNVSKSDVQQLIYGTFNGFEAAIVQDNQKGNAMCGCPGGLYDGGLCYYVPEGGIDSGMDGGMMEGGGDSGGGMDTGVVDTGSAMDTGSVQDAAGQ